VTWSLAQIWRHPIKGIGKEALDRVTLSERAPLPGDRAWAVRHAGAAKTGDWQPRRNFLVVAHGPRLAQATAESLPGDRLRVRHPDRPDIDIDPETDGAMFVDWAAPLWPDAHSAPERLVRAPAHGMADNGRAQVSILNLASLRALSDCAGAVLQIERFRGNLVLEGLAPWEEFDLVGETLAIGDTRLDVTDRIGRCRATEASPLTGRRDIDTLRVMDGQLGHRDFGVYATVVRGGGIAVGQGVRRA